MAAGERRPRESGFLADGAHRIWWELHGTGDQEVVCLLNGLAMHTKAWYPFLDDRPGYDVLLYDYLGQGASSSPDEPIEINLNVNIRQEVIVRLERDAEELLQQNQDLF